MYPHRIRLRGPWDYEPLARRVSGPDGLVELVTYDLPPAARITMPARWSAAGLVHFAGRVRFTRHFGVPRRLDQDERVWLTFGGVTGFADVSLNGERVGSQTEGDGPFEFDITSLLQEINRLVVDVDSAMPDGGLWGEVALEIRRTAFLRGVEVELHDQAGAVELQVKGEIAGTSARPLEIYVVAGRSTIAYSEVEAGRSFLLVSERFSQERWQQASQVSVELVEGATVWYRLERSIGRAP
jgi:Glycosyl hydrolases family 2, sugar binding domain